MSSKDPRVVQATLMMIQDMGINMNVEQLYELCARIAEMPIENVDMMALDFIGKIMDHVRTKFSRLPRDQQVSSR